MSTFYEDDLAEKANERRRQNDIAISFVVYIAAALGVGIYKGHPWYGLGAGILFCAVAWYGASLIMWLIDWSVGYKPKR